MSPTPPPANDSDSPTPPLDDQGRPMSRTPKPYTAMTDAEVETLAQDVVARRVFGSWDLGPPGSPDMLRMIFMPLGFMTAEDVAALKAANITNFYEYLDKAGPRSVNGYPCFFSMKLLDQDDSKRLLASVLELQSVLKRRMEEASAKADKASG